MKKTLTIIAFSVAGYFLLKYLLKKRYGKKEFVFDYVKETGNDNTMMLVTSDTDAITIQKDDVLEIRVTDGDKSYNGNATVVESIKDLKSGIQFITINKPKNKAASGKIKFIEN